MDRLPLECVLSILEMALDKDDYWTLSEFLGVCAGLRGLRRGFASVLTWETVSRSLSVRDARTDCVEDMDKTYTKTQAKSLFRLTDKDMEDLPYRQKCNPRFRSAPSMRLYTMRVLLQKAKKKYGTKRQMNEQKAIQAQRAAKRQQTKDHARLRRRAELVEKLGRRGLELRGDSRLCHAYIENGHGDVDQITDCMHEMDFYHRHTDYQRYYRQLWRERNEYYPDEISEMAKHEALRSFALGRTDCPDYVPPHTPWNREKTPRNMIILFSRNKTEWNKMWKRHSAPSHGCDRKRRVPNNG
jgi:hypothetical protein